MILDFEILDLRFSIRIDRSKSAYETTAIGRKQVGVFYASMHYKAVIASEKSFRMKPVLRSTPAVTECR